MSRVSIPQLLGADGEGLALAAGQDADFQARPLASFNPRPSRTSKTFSCSPSAP